MMGRRKKKQQSSVAPLTFTVPYFQATRGYTSTWLGGATGATGAVEAPAPREIKDLGLSIEPIIGVRAFRTFLEDPWTLYSYNGAPWPPGEQIQAFCGDDVFAAHDAPNEDCQCGIYAWRQDRPELCVGKLTGEIYMWGDVLIGELGYRSEFAYPKSLTITTVATRVAARVRDGLEEAYGVPVTLVEPPETPVADDLTSFSMFHFGGSSKPVLGS